ncbi:MAG: FAD-binding protein [Burkholderiales bacterium]|nr:FAD-binding protein [Burkholderiales bacterium]
MYQLDHVWIVSDERSRLPELISGGARLGKKVSVFVWGDESQIRDAFSYGANRVYTLGDRPLDTLIEDYAPTLADTIKKETAKSLVLLPATRSGKALAAKLGARLKAGVINDAADITVTETGVHATHRVYGGLALGKEKILSTVALLTVGVGAFEPASCQNNQVGEVIAVDFIEPKARIQCIECKAKEGNIVDLTQAKRVIGIGRGIAHQEDIKTVETLCAVMSAELGCTRPIAEGEKWMDKSRYIGVSGVTLKPEVYLALGVSGQIQHMAGVNAAQCIFAVNKDKNAPIFQNADYGIVGDIYKVIPALIKALA